MRIDTKLKIEKQYFRQVAMDNKKFEIRENRDRDFKVGQYVLLEEIDASGELTGEAILVKITYVTDYEQKDGYVVFSFQVEVY